MANSRLCFLSIKIESLQHLKFAYALKENMKKYVRSLRQIWRSLAWRKRRKFFKLLPKCYLMIIRRAAKVTKRLQDDFKMFSLFEVASSLRRLRERIGPVCSLSTTCNYFETAFRFLQKDSLVLYKMSELMKLCQSKTKDSSIGAPMNADM